MTNSADPDQLASSEDLHCLLRQGISGFSRIRVKTGKNTKNIPPQAAQSAKKKKKKKKKKTLTVQEPSPWSGVKITAKEL